jgi:hypothetical protein
LYDFAFDKRNLRREFIRGDFKANPLLLDDGYISNVVNAAEAQAAGGITGLSLATSLLRGKPIYHLDTIEHALILRKFSRNIARLTRVRQSDRDTIVKCLKALLAEGHTFRMYKLDLRSFYESIDRDDIERQLRNDGGVPPSTLKVFHSFSDQLDASSISGVPRGLSVSAILSEYVMRRFDHSVKSVDNVYFYARYVDDIVIMTTGYENKRNFLKNIIRALPSGIQLNSNKTKTIEFGKPKVKANADAVEDSLDFLGYRFNVHRMIDQPIKRNVYADISPNKTKRFKTRVILSALQFIKDGIFDDFFDRIRVLTGNYNVYDFDRKLKRNVGIYFNYRFIDGPQSNALTDLDQFLKRFILAKNGRIGSQLSQLLSARQKQKILQLSFRRSFDTRGFQHFPTNRLVHLVGCWAYE